MALVSVRPLQLVVAAAAVRGAPPDELLAAARIDGAALADPDGWVTQAAEHRLWRAVERLTGDPDIGLHVVEAADARDYGAVGFVVRSSATVGDAYVRLARFFRFIVPGARLNVTREGSFARLDHHPPPGGLPPHRHSIEALFHQLVLVVRRWAEPSFRPLAVRFRHEAPGDPREHARLLSDQVAFGQGDDVIVMPAEALDLPLRTGESDLCAVLERHLVVSMRAVPALESTLVDRVHRVLLEGIREGCVTLPWVARRLSTTPRSLQRRLRAAETSVDAIHTELRCHLAELHLAERDDSIAEIAFLLGFSEVSTFHRAFRAWTGETPGAFRDRHAAGLPGGTPVGKVRRRARSAR